MRTKCLLLTVCLLLLAPAATLAADKPVIYTVKEGDTLWDISRRFIKDPFYWPNLWSHNPDIANPHLIYPGQKLRITDGRIEVIPTHQEPAVEGVPTVTEPVPVAEKIDLVSTYGGARGFIGSAELNTAGTLLDTIDNRYLIGAGEKIFLDMHDLETVRPGDTYQLMAIGKKVMHPVNHAPVGYLVNDLGVAEIVETTPSVAVAMVVDAKKEILRGSLVRPYIEPPEQVVRKTSDQKLLGYILTAADDKIALGQYDVIHIDLGAADGLEVGHALKIFRPRELSKAAREMAGREISLPDIDLGKAVVVDVQEDTAAAVIVEIGNLPLYRGDRIATLTP